MELKPGKNKAYNAGLKIIKLLRKSGFQAFFVGGAVRDMFLGLSPDNIDIATDATPIETEKIMERAWLSPKSVGKKYGTILIITNGLPIEITTFRAEGRYSDRRHPDEVKFVDSYEQDAKRRDFTINAMYYDPETKQLFDPENGQKDITAKLIRFVGKPTKRIDEDALRMLRAARLSGQLGFKLEKNSFAAIKTRAKYIQGVSGERIKKELDKILISKNRVASIRLLDNLGILRYLIPGVEKSKTITHASKKFHLEGSVFDHTMLAIEQTDDLITLYATLFHDLGKVHTKVRAFHMGEWVFRYFGHQQKSAEMFRDFAQRLRFPKADAKLIEWLILHHDDRLQFRSMREPKQVNYIRQPNFDLLLKVWYADSMANIRILEDGTKGVRPSPTYTDSKKILARLKKIQPMIARLASGDKIISLTGIKPGPKIKSVQDQIIFLIYKNGIKNESDLKKFLKKFQKTT